MKPLIDRIRELEVKKAPEYLKERVKNRIFNEDIKMKWNIWDSWVIRTGVVASLAVFVFIVVIKNRDIEINKTIDIKKPVKIENIAGKDVSSTVEVVKKSVPANVSPTGSNLKSNKTTEVTTKSIWETNPPKEQAKGPAKETEKPVSAMGIGKTGVQVAQKEAEFRFEKVAPNPFTPNGDGINDKINFYFINPKNEEIQIRILNLKGMLIRNITVNLNEMPYWDGKDNDGQLSEGGIYIFQLKSGSKTLKGSIVLAK
ncbi:MAG: hypothetical protein A3J83_06440 [Elusimicrobia bacterium RIFOXYA2_FULL_40_6]|nr:MAG: hypothetical protein A3J83_06440 [Elusimicrobia bacterium RIFOXYA2_FULL_40_6]